MVLYSVAYSHNALCCLAIYQPQQPLSSSHAYRGGCCRCLSYARTDGYTHAHRHTHPRTPIGSSTLP